MLTKLGLHHHFAWQAEGPPEPKKRAPPPPPPKRRVAEGGVLATAGLENVPESMKQVTIEEETRAARWRATRGDECPTVHTVGYKPAPETSMCLRKGVEV